MNSLHQNAANTLENERFELNNVANFVDRAASSFKLLQITANIMEIDKTGSKRKWKKHMLKNELKPYSVGSDSLAAHLPPILQRCLWFLLVHLGFPLHLHRGCSQVPEAYSAAELQRLRAAYAAKDLRSAAAQWRATATAAEAVEERCLEKMNHGKILGTIKRL